jgi:amidase/aspartyl-tRNA(Asn)/glutamyl-tRNA(Gln) amidotransferase subunit A
MGFRGCTDNLLFGPSRNPFDTSRNTGGSSGGAAGAVADGLLPFAEGTDGGGSIRIPASWCGVYGFKASAGRIPFVARPNAFGGVSPFLHTGAITRDVEDAALVTGVLAAHDPRDPFSVDERVDLLAATRRGIRGWRIAWSPRLDVFPVEPEVAAITAKAVRAFEEAGAVVEEVELGIDRPQRELSDLWCRLIMPTNLRALAGLKRAGHDLMRDHPEDLPAEYRRWVETARTQTVEEHYADQEIRTGIFDAVQGVLGRYDLLVCPTLSCTTVLNRDDGDTKGPEEIDGEAIDPLIGWCPTYLFNFTGHPAASVPCGQGAGGLPVGLQLVGRRWADADVIAASAAFERLRPWAGSYRVPASRPLPA